MLTSFSFFFYFKPCCFKRQFWRNWLNNNFYCVSVRRASSRPDTCQLIQICQKNFPNICTHLATDCKFASEAHLILLKQCELHLDETAGMWTKLCAGYLLDCGVQVVSSAIVDKYIGESARLIREMFSYARDHQPCIIFMDEIDAIGLLLSWSRTDMIKH